jgi:choline-sulfatase
MFVRENWDEGMWRIHRWLYARLTERVDRHLGRILDVLQQSQYANNTLVVFTSDHGDLNSAHRMEHKCVPYDESVRVPFIMSFPGKIPAGVVDEEHFISNGLDLLPTLCDYAGIDAPEYLPGRSLRPLAENKDVEWRDCIFAESQNARLVCNDKFTYMIFDSGKDCEFLIDRKNDPGEMHNIAYDEKYKEQLNHMRQLLQDWVKKIDDNIGKKYILAPQS